MKKQTNKKTQEKPHDLTQSIFRAGTLPCVMTVQLWCLVLQETEIESASTSRKTSCALWGSIIRSLSSLHQPLNQLLFCPHIERMVILHHAGHGAGDPEDGEVLLTSFET